MSFQLRTQQLGSCPNLANSSNKCSKPRKLVSPHLLLNLETDLATSLRFSAISAHARPRRNDSSLETILCTPSRETESFRTRIMFLSERDCHRWKSFDIRPAISKANTPTEAFLDGFGIGVEVLTESKL
ncbi:hypothetical protein OIU77_007280 [Salix suchowensis]|uniref:Uncharacterized protein n=1 Tax=Salix suchowensis TaxID=1278906 RepID=A0ABQ9AGV2_9ROSI|nr:hypothetical protein OIU77_007280 [Salix suchowensis]